MVEIDTVARLYNFMQRQLFVTDTYVQAEAGALEDGCGGACGGALEPHRIESALLPQVMRICLSSAVTDIPAFTRCIRLG